MNFNRRSFIKKAVITGSATAAIPAILNAAIPGSKKDNKGDYNIINSGDVILFQGDSITDAGRNRGDKNPNSNGGFGTGYAFLTASKLLQELADRDLSIYNRGISGNKVYQLTDRWHNDCLSLRPNLLSILIGVNDFWHTLTHDYKGTVEVYENDLIGLLRSTVSFNPGVRFVIGEPFAVKGCSAVDEKWFPEFDKYREAAKRVATEMKAIFIPYQKIFDEALNYAPATYWTRDGVHPSMAGCELMSKAWLKAVDEA